MADRRMFSKSIIDSDAFLDMPISARLLYYDLSMRADDDGFINSPKKIQRMIGASEDDIKVLITKKFIIPFESGVVVIKHWKIHNYIQNDRYKPTVYTEEMAKLSVKNNKSYSLDTDCIQVGYEVDTQVRLGKDRLELDKNRVKEKKEPSLLAIPQEQHLKKHFAEFVTMTNEEYEKLCSAHSKDFVDQCIFKLNNYKGSKGKTYKSDYRAILSWVVDSVKNNGTAKVNKPSSAYVNPAQKEFEDLDNGSFYAN